MIRSVLLFRTVCRIKDHPVILKDNLINIICLVAFKFLFYYYDFMAITDQNRFLLYYKGRKIRFMVYHKREILNYCADSSKFNDDDKKQA